MKEWDVYYLGLDGTAGRFKGLVIHVCPAGKKAGRLMVPPLVGKVTVTCDEADLAKFYQLNYQEHTVNAEGDRILSLSLRSRFIVDTVALGTATKVALKQLPITDRLTAASALRDLGIAVKA